MSLRQLVDGPSSRRFDRPLRQHAVRHLAKWIQFCEACSEPVNCTSPARLELTPQYSWLNLCPNYCVAVECEYQRKSTRQTCE
jgi:hypothetical protein